MTIEKLEEFASNGDKHLTGLDVATGFPRADKPERPWFNKLFGDITGKINEVVDSVGDLPFEDGVLADTFVVVDGSLSQRTINRGLESIADLSTIINPKDGLRVYVKSYHANMSRGGGWFYYDSTKVSFVDEFGRTVTNDKGRFINGWVRIVENNEFTPEMFGAYGDAEKLGHDDWQAIEDMFQSLMPCGTGTNMSWTELGNSWTGGHKRVVRIDRLFKHSKTLFIPPNIKIKQSNWQDTQVRKATQGFWYSPAPELRATTCAISNYVYTKIDTSVTSPQQARWYLNKDALYHPTAAEQDINYYAFGWGMEFDDLTVITDEDVVLGVRFINVHTKTEGLTIGGYLHGLSYQNSKCPRVGLFHLHSYGSVHYNMRVRSDVQGIVVGSSGAGVVFYSPWITQSNRKQRSTDYVPVFKTDAHTETGSVGITYIKGEAHFANPIYENWNIHVLAIDSIFPSIYRPHSESLVFKHEFYLINSSLVSELKTSLGDYDYRVDFKDWDGSDVTYANASAIYLKNCTEASSVYLGGAVSHGGGVLLLGENSARIVELDYVFTQLSEFVVYGKLGDMSLLRKANWGELGFDEIIINATTGNDKYVGLKRAIPRKTLKDIDVYVDRCGIKTVIIDSMTTIDSNILLPNKPVLITGSANIINMQSFSFNAYKTIDVTVGSALTFNKTTPEPFISLSDAADANVRLYSNVSLAGTVITAKGRSNIDLMINNTTAKCAAYVSATTPYAVVLGLNVVTTSIIPNPSFTPNMCIKYKSVNITQAI